MSVRAQPASRLRREAVFPNERERWPGRWIDERGVTIYGLLDPATGDVATVDPFDDPDLPGLARWLSHGELVGYRTGRRAVVRLAGAPPRYVKIVRPSHLAGLLARHKAFDNARTRAGADRRFPDAPAVIQHDGTEGSLMLAELPGAPVASLGAASAGGVVPAVAEALVALQSAHPEAGALPDYHARSPGRWAELVARVSPSVAETASQVAAELPVEPQPRRDRIVLLHGDLHDGNVVISPHGRTGILDLDSLAAGHPAVDPANLAAHLVLRTVQRGGRAAEGNRCASELLVTYVAAGGQAAPAELAAMAARTLHRLACVHAFRAQFEHLPLMLLAEAQRWSQGY